MRQVKSHRALHKLALKAYSLRHPPPYALPNMEFAHDAWNSISSLHYSGGRQIGEDNTGPYPYYETTHNEYVSCPFSDSRQGLPMNVTNLRLVMPYAEDAYALTTALRNRYIVHRKLPSQRFNLVQAYLFSKFAVSLPAYLTRRRERPVRDGMLQPLETAFYMLGTAPFMLVRQMMVRGDVSALDPNPLDAMRLYELTDQWRVLISTRSRACPGSPKLIADFFDVIMNGAFSGSLDAPDVLRALEVLGDWDSFYTYARAASRIELLVKLNQTLTALRLLALRSGPAQSATLDRVLQQAMQRSFIRVAAGQDATAVMRATVQVLLTLLADHEEPTLDAIRATVQPDSDPSPAKAAAQIDATGKAITLGCAKALADVHAALGRRGWGSIDEQALMQRTAGIELGDLLAHLHTAA